MEMCILLYKNMCRHRLQLSRNLRESLCPGRPYFGPIVCPGSRLDSSTMSLLFTTGDQTAAYHV